MMNSYKIGDHVKIKYYLRNRIYGEEPDYITGKIEFFYHNHKKEIAGLKVAGIFIGFDEYVLWDIQLYNKSKKEHLPMWF